MRNLERHTHLDNSVIWEDGECIANFTGKNHIEYSRAFLSCIPAEPQPEPQPFKRYVKYEVIKVEDIGKYLSAEQKANLDNIINTLHVGREKDGKRACNSYVVVNEDMPYAEAVWKLIESYETKKPAQPPTLEEEIQKNVCMFGGIFLTGHRECCLDCNKYDAGKCKRSEAILAAFRRVVEGMPVEFTEAMDDTGIWTWQVSGELRKLIQAYLLKQLGGQGK